MLCKINKIGANTSETMLNSGYFITILHTNLGKLSRELLKDSARTLMPISVTFFNLTAINFPVMLIEQPSTLELFQFIEKCNLLQYTFSIITS